jgi:hypothetical protein
MKVLEWLSKPRLDYSVPFIVFDSKDNQAMAKSEYSVHAARPCAVYDESNHPTYQIDGQYQFKRKGECGLFTRVDKYFGSMQDLLAKVDLSPVTIEILVNPIEMQNALSGFARDVRHPIRMVIHGQESPFEMYGYADNGASLYVVANPMYFYSSGRSWRPK